MIVGEGGCSADYFFNRMGITEAVGYIKGLNRRHRQSWEQSRMLCRLVYKLLSGEDLEWDFPWDSEQESEEPEATKEELAALREKARKMEILMNGGKNE